MHWNSDWNGYEVGYPEIDLVELYSDGDKMHYVNAENGHILESWESVDEE